MVLTEDHAAVYPSMITGWKRAYTKYSEIPILVEFVQWNNKIITRNGEHYVQTSIGEPYRVYGPCQPFAQGDYICRTTEGKSFVWVVRQKDFPKEYTVL